MLQDDVRGYDCRVWGSGHLSLWDAERRARFLLKPEVGCPLSVDPLSWPSVFDTGGPQGFLGFKGIPLPEFIGRHPPLWEDLSELEAVLRSNAVDMERARIVRAIRFDEELASQREPELSVKFERLGFDVVDEGLISAVSSCGFTDAEWDYLRRRFARSLNEHHLFSEWEAARDFSRVADELIPEHAPFAPFQLAWLRRSE